MGRTLYSGRNWKSWLAVAAAFIVLGTLLYTNYLIKLIGFEERQKVELWAKAVQNRAELVKRSNAIFKEFEVEDRKNINLWAEANQFMVQFEGDGDIYFPSRILTNNTTIPVIITDLQGRILFTNNFPESVEADSNALNLALERLRLKNAPIDVSYKIGRTLIPQFLYYDDSRIYNNLRNTLDSLVQSFISETVINAASVPVVFTNETGDSLVAYGNLDVRLKNAADSLDLIAQMQYFNSIPIELGDGQRYLIYYRDSKILYHLRYFPFVFLAIVAAFLLTGYVLLSLARRGEQNMLWVGMSKETAHQLGTPISSLMGWVEVLKMQGVNAEALTEINRDVDRLQNVAERFSKIGSLPDLQPGLLSSIASQTLDYLRPRIRPAIAFEFENLLDEEPEINLNTPLMIWALENLIRNGVDATQGPGLIRLELGRNGNKLYLDVSDTGKGINRKYWKQVFKPGYTTKKRGWGLGLSLTRRIVETYHKGRIFVKWSEPDKGTTFRLQFFIQS
jgi:two-component system, sporulation sensor kinase D